MKEVIDEFGRHLTVDDEKRRLYDYSNREGWIVYSAPVMESGKTTGFYANYKEPGTVDDLEEKLKKWNNKLIFAYAQAVDMQAEKNDPDRELWKVFTDYIEEHEADYFDAAGDFRADMVIDDDVLADLTKRLERTIKEQEA